MGKVTFTMSLSTNAQFIHKNASLIDLHEEKATLTTFTHVYANMILAHQGQTNIPCFKK